MFAGEKFNTGTVQIPFWTDSLGTILNWLAENGTIVGAKQQKASIEPRKELTEDEQFLVNSYVTALKKESDLVLESIANALYAKVKDLTEI